MPQYISFQLGSRVQGVHIDLIKLPTGITCTLFFPGHFMVKRENGEREKRESSLESEAAIHLHMPCDQR